MHKTIFRLFLFLLIFSPLAFGTVEPWSLTVMETISFLTLLLYVVQISRNKEVLYKVPGLIPLLLFLGYMLFQLIPIPPQVLAVLSPHTFTLYKDTIGRTGDPAWLPLSINVRDTLMEFFRYGAYGSFYFLTVQLLSRKELLKRTVITIAVFATILSIFAIVQLFTSKDTIYWLRQAGHNSIILGPYVNHNHYAGLMEMIMPLVLSLVFYYQPHVKYKKSLRQKVTDFFNQRQTNIHILLGFSAILIATSIFLSLSRGGIIGMCVSMLFLTTALLIKAHKKAGGLLLLFLSVLIVLAVSWFGWDSVLDRFTRIRIVQGEINVDRLQYWKDIPQICRDFFLTGSGFGTFGAVYPSYRTFPGRLTVSHAHNDYLELFTDGGIIGFVLAAWFLGAVLYKTFIVYRQRRDSYSIHLFLGAIAGIIALLIHSFSDFNLHIGANGLFFFFLAGLAVSAANTRLHGHTSTFLAKKHSPFIPLGGVCGIILALALCLLFNLGILAARFNFASVEDRLREAPNITKEELIRIGAVAAKASQFDPLAAQYQFAQGYAALLLKDPTTAQSFFKEAVKKEPANGQYLQKLGFVTAKFGEEDLAAEFFKAGVTYDQNNPSRYTTYASWLFARGQWEQGIDLMKKAILLDPGRLPDYITQMLLDGLADEQIQQAIPAKAGPTIAFAQYLWQIDREEMAENVYRAALEYATNEKVARPWHFYKIYEFYMRQACFDQALAVMQRAIDTLPDDPGLRITAAKLYEKLGITYRAIEEYKSALVLAPGNKQAREHLERLTTLTAP